MKHVDLKKRVTAAVLTAGILFSFSGCKDSKKKDSKKSGKKETANMVQGVDDSDNTDDPTRKTEPVTDTPTPTPTPAPAKSIDEIKTINGPMLTIHCEDEGPYDYYEDENRDCSYTLYYNGRLERMSFHSVSDPVKSTVTIPDNDLLNFYDFCLQYGDGSAFAGYSEDVCDGTMYSFSYHDENGQRHGIYSGYCYEVPELMNTVHRAADYFDPDFSVSCMNRIKEYEGLLDTVTNLSCPQVKKVNKLPDDVVLEKGVDIDRASYFYEYTYTTTEDAEKGPIVCYVSNYGWLVAMKNNRNWDVVDLIIEVNGKTLTAQWDPAMYNTDSMMMILYQQGSVTVEMKDCEFGKEGYVKDLQGSAVKPIECKPGAIIICMNEQYVDFLYIVTKEGEYRGSPLATINSVTQEELEEILGEGTVTVTIRDADEQ